MHTFVRWTWITIAFSFGALLTALTLHALVLQYGIGWVATSFVAMLMVNITTIFVIAKTNASSLKSEY